MARGDSNYGKRKPIAIQQGPQAADIDTMLDQLYRRLAAVEAVAESADETATAAPARVYVFTSRLTPAAGAQAPDFYADQALTLDYVQASGASRVAAVTVDLLVNGASVFPTTTKPDAPLAGGVGTRRVPDNRDVAQGDRLTVSFASADFTDADKIVVYIGAH